MCWTETGSCYVFRALFCHVMHNDEETNAKSSDDIRISWMKTARLGSYIASSLDHDGRGHC